VTISSRVGRAMILSITAVPAMTSCSVGTATSILTTVFGSTFTVIASHSETPPFHPQSPTPRPLLPSALRVPGCCTRHLRLCSVVWTVAGGEGEDSIYGEENDDAIVN